MLSEKYIAGFFDADGCVMMQFSKDCSRPQLAVNFSQKTSQAKVLHCIQEVAGGSIRENVIKDNSYSLLTLCGKNARNLLSRILKYMVVKRHYANVCLSIANKPADKDEVKAYLRNQRKIKSLPLPNYPSKKWLAGYFDGDGCLAVSRIRKPSGKAVVVSHIASSDYDSEGLELIHKAFGGRLNWMKSNCRQWQLDFDANRAKKFLGYFAKHLITKKEQAYFILGCAEMGHFRDGINIKSALKSLKTHDHRLNDSGFDITSYLSTIRDLPPYKRDYSGFYRDSKGRIRGRNKR